MTKLSWGRQADDSYVMDYTDRVVSVTAVGILGPVLGRRRLTPVSGSPRRVASFVPGVVRGTPRRDQ
jgi:hypothetical protein